MRVVEKALALRERLRRRNGSSWEDAVSVLRAKWGCVPMKVRGRTDSARLLELSDSRLLEAWEGADRTQGVMDNRGWYRLLYADYLRGKSVLDMGCGLGFDGVFFAACGAQVVFADIVASNVEVVRRICAIRDIGAEFISLDSLIDIASFGEFDAVLAIGSLHHAPFKVVKPEVGELVKHLRVGGRWLQLAYPKCRWERQGRLPFSVWGNVTDGDGTPWAEWYDVAKLKGLLGREFKLVFYHEFHNGDFNWFDFVRDEG